MKRKTTICSYNFIESEIDQYKSTVGGIVISDCKFKVYTRVIDGILQVMPKYINTFYINGEAYGPGWSIIEVTSFMYPIFKKIHSFTEKRELNKEIKENELKAEYVIKSLDNTYTEYEFVKKLYEEHELICIVMANKKDANIYLASKRDPVIISDVNGKARIRDAIFRKQFHVLGLLKKVRLDGVYTDETLKKCFM